MSTLPLLPPGCDRRPRPSQLRRRPSHPRADSTSRRCLPIVNEDSFYRGLTAEESAHAQDYNFDHPGDVASRSWCVLMAENLLVAMYVQICICRRRRVEKHFSPSYSSF